MKKKWIVVPEEMTKGYTRREFLKMLELAGIGVTIASSGIMFGCGKESGSLADAKEAITRCGLCGGDCGMKVYIKDNRVQAVAPWMEDPRSKGFMCDMGLANVEQTYSPDRVLNPKRRIGDKWEDISWEDALDIIAAKLTDLKRDPGPQSVVCHYGVSQVRAGFFRSFFSRFANVYGTPNFTGCGSQCAASTAIAKRYSIGAVSDDYENTNCMVLWGCNPSTSSFLQWVHEILPAKERGAKLICIDPRSSRMTDMADIHLRPRPGTDGALALSMMHVIINEKGVDEAFFQENGIGFSELKHLVAAYPPNVAETITGIPAKDIVDTTMVYLNNSPACVETGNALELHANGVQTIRAVQLLQALSGNLGRKGGSLVSTGGRPEPVDLKLAERLPDDIVGYSADRYPILWKTRKMVTANLVPETILSGKPYPIKAMMVIGGNPVITGPNSSHQRDAYKKLDLMVVMDLFMTETAKAANLFLPATSSLERDIIKAKKKIYLTPGVIPPRGQAWPEWKFLFELAAKMGYQKEFPWTTLDEAIDEHLAPVNMTASDLRQKFEGIEVPTQTGQSSGEGLRYKTPSGKIEFSSPGLAEAGYDPLPSFVMPFEDASYNALKEQYPLIMTSGLRIPQYYHSQFHNLPSLKAKVPEPVLEMSPGDASNRGIVDGDYVSVRSPRGAIRVKACLVKGLKSGIIAMNHGWNAPNVNELTDDVYLDPISSFPTYRGFFCSVEKA